MGGENVRSAIPRGSQSSMRGYSCACVGTSIISCGLGCVFRRYSVVRRLQRPSAHAISSTIDVVLFPSILPLSFHFVPRGRQTLSNVAWEELSSLRMDARRGVGNVHGKGSDARKARNARADPTRKEQHVTDDDDGPPGPTLPWSLNKQTSGDLW